MRGFRGVAGHAAPCVIVAMVSGRGCTSIVRDVPTMPRRMYPKCSYKAPRDLGRAQPQASVRRSRRPWDHGGSGYVRGGECNG